MAAEDTPRLQLELVAPAGMVYHGEVDMVVVPVVTGEVGILPRHAPFVGQLSIGRLRALADNGEWLNFAVAEGFVKVQFDKVIVLADAAEKAEQIDVERARRSVERAIERLEMYHAGTVPEDDHVDPYREQTAVQRGRNRIKVAEMS